jgi:hypothetical protein
MKSDPAARSNLWKWTCTCINFQFLKRQQKLPAPYQHNSVILPQQLTSILKEEEEASDRRQLIYQTEKNAHHSSRKKKKKIHSVKHGKSEASLPVKKCR